MEYIEEVVVITRGQCDHENFAMLSTHSSQSALTASSGTAFWVTNLGKYTSSKKHACFSETALFKLLHIHELTELLRRREWPWQAKRQVVINVRAYSSGFYTRNHGRKLLHQASWTISTKPDATILTYRYPTSDKQHLIEYLDLI